MNKYSSTDPLVSFLYSLLRDHLPAGKVEELVLDTSTEETVFTNGYLAQYAEDVANRLRVSDLVKFNSDEGTVMVPQAMLNEMDKTQEELEEEIREVERSGENNWVFADCHSFARNIFPVQNLPDGAKPVYESLPEDNDKNSKLAKSMYEDYVKAEEADIKGREQHYKDVQKLIKEQESKYKQSLDPTESLKKLVGEMDLERRKALAESMHEAYIDQRKKSNIGTIEFAYNKGPLKTGIGYLKWETIRYANYHKLMPVLECNLQCGAFVLSNINVDSFKFWVDEQDNDFITIDGDDAVKLKAFVVRGPVL